MPDRKEVIKAELDRLYNEGRRIVEEGRRLAQLQDELNRQYDVLIKELNNLREAEKKRERERGDS